MTVEIKISRIYASKGKLRDIYNIIHVYKYDTSIFELQHLPIYPIWSQNFWLPEHFSKKNSVFTILHLSFSKTRNSTKTPSEFPCCMGMPVSLAEFGRCYCLRFDAKVRWSHGGRTHFPWAVSSIYPKDSAGMTQGWGVLVLKMTPVCEGVRILGVWYICSPTFG